MAHYVDMNFLQELVLSQAQGKAIPNHPALRDNVPTTTYVPGGRPQRKPGELSQSEARRHMQAYGGNEAMDWIMDCVDLYADTASSAPFRLLKDGTQHWMPNDEDRPEGAPLIEQQLADLLTMPNPYMDYIELMQLLVIDLLLVGNAYWYKYRMSDDGKPLALYRLSPLDVKVVPGPYGIESYSYQPSGAKRKLKIDPKELVHFKRPNPHSPYYGLGVIKGGGRPLDLELAITDATAHYYENRADPSLIVQSERRVPRDVFRKLTQQLRARASGPRNAGELLVLESGLKASTLSRTAADAMFKEIGSASRDRILAMFRVHPKLLGLASAGGADDKVQDARREFDNKTMRPFLDKLERRLTTQLLSAYGYEYVIDYKYIMPVEELVKLASDLGSVPGIMVKEVRGFLADGKVIPTATTGDKEIDDLVLNLPGEDADEDGQPLEGDAALADRSLPREPGRPPLGENTAAIPRNGGALPAGARARRKTGTKALSVSDVLDRLDDLGQIHSVKAVPNLEQEGRTTIGNRLPDEKRPQDSLAGARERQVDAIVGTTTQEIMQAVTTLERLLLDHSEGKAFDGGSLVRRIRSSEAWKAFMGLMTSALEKATRQAASVAAMQQLEAGHRPEDEVDYDAIAKSIVYREDGVRSITDNLKSDIVQKIAKVLEEGGGKQEVDAAIRESVDFWRQGKAETVALTEATHAYNEATLTVFEQSGIKEVVVYEEEDAPDEPCQEARHQVWTIPEARKRRIEHPRCRRAFVAVGSELEVGS